MDNRQVAVRQTIMEIKLEEKNIISKIIRVKKKKHLMFSKEDNADI
jgi:hypothetical protein